ncbi:hypothetical protein [Paenibacillus sp. SN-8-1]|uniref:hypothetical protein n=1 Tax=Paenibacillus sp. SN-8-1 TaxID=3435409 RepID=UPI003D9A45C5
MILLTGLIPTTEGEYLVSTIHYNPETLTSNPNLIEGLTSRGLLGDGVGYLVDRLPQTENKPNYDYYLRLKDNKPYWVEVVRQLNVVSKQEVDELKQAVADLTMTLAAMMG